MNNDIDGSSFKVEKNMPVSKQWFGMALFSMLFFVVFSAQSNDDIDHLNVVDQVLAQQDVVTSCIK